MTGSRTKGPACMTSGRGCRGQLLFSPKADLGRKLAWLLAASEEVAQGNSHCGLLFSSSELIMTASLFQGSGRGKFSAESNGLQWEHHRNTKGRGGNRSHLGAPPPRPVISLALVEPSLDNQKTQWRQVPSPSRKASSPARQGSRWELGSYRRRRISRKS